MAVFTAGFFGIPAGFLKERVRSSFQDETGYHLQITGPVKIGLWPSLAVAAEEIAVSDPKATGQREKFNAQRIQVQISLSSLLSGPIRINHVTVTKPTVYVQMVRERAEPRGSGSPASTSSARPQADLEQVTVRDGTLVLYDSRAKTESRVEGIDVDAFYSPADRRFDIVASGKSGEQPLKLTVKSLAPVKALDTPFPIDATVEAPGLLKDPLQATANAALTDKSLNVTGLRGQIGPHVMNGAVAVDFAAAKPFVNADLDFQRLELDANAVSAPSPTSKGGAPEPWSDRDFKLTDLNYFDAGIHLTAGQFSYRKFHLSPLAIKASIANGILTATLAQSDVYEGHMAGVVVVDASRPVFGYAARLEMNNVRAFPLLSDAADFEWIEGRMTAKFDLRATGNNPRAIAGSMSGTSDVNFQDGQIRGINVADMVRSLMSTILTGWQENDAKKTDFSQLSATFQAKDGQATTLDLNLAGPLVRMRGAGTIDLLTKQIAFRLDPKVVATLEGQGSQADPLGLGVPVIVQGPWTQPQIYPDVAGIRDNPAAAFDKLRDLGAGLFGVFTGDQKGDAKSQDLMKSLNDIFSGKKDNPGAASSGNPGAAPGSSPSSAPSGGTATNPAPVSGDTAKPSDDGQNNVGNFIRDLFGKGK
jgi:AsmA protein